MKYWLILLTAVLISCEKEFDNSDQEGSLALPPYSTSGSNTFGFLYNDSVWTNFGKSWQRDSREWEDNMVKAESFVTGSGERVVQLYGRLSLVKQSNAYRDLSASLRFRPDTPYVKTYQADGLLNTFTFFDQKTNRLLSARPGFILEVTRLDTIAKICSGRISGTLINKNNQNDSVRITEGRFDVKINW